MPTSSSKIDSYFDCLLSNDLEKIKKYPNNSLFVRNSQQKTALNFALSNSCREETIDTLLLMGASASIFVKGYNIDSLVCTLPMAQQPLSSVFNHPEPIEIAPHLLSKLDNDLSRYIKDISAKSILQHKPPEKEISLAPISQASTNAQSLFNHFPKALKLNDFVRRGPDWKFGVDEDIVSSIPVCGKVVSVSSSGDKYEVEWSSDINSWQASGKMESYSYDITRPILELFVLEPSNLSLTKIPKIPKNARKAENFKVGDLVKLDFEITRSSLVGDNLPKEYSKNCLGEVSGNKIGVIVRVSNEIHADPRNDAANNFIVTVMELEMGKLCTYASSDLIFADGSKRGFPSDDIIAVKTIGLSPSLATPVKPTKFKSGDKVTIKATASDTRGCLGKKAYKFVGTVENVRIRGSGDIAIEVVCLDARRNPIYQGQLNYPHHTYDSNEIELANASGLNSSIPRPLSVGDRVCLSKTFNENKGNGWCLGNAGSNNIGIVLFAPSNLPGEKEQGNILVATDDNMKKVYAYKASWLERVANDGSVEYKVGDRVQLDLGNYDESLDGGKCLGKPSDCIYGRVCSVGTKRDSIQRNIEVVAVGNKRISLYSSYSLRNAVRETILSPQDRINLIIELQRVCQSIGVKSPLDFIEGLVEDVGNLAWGRIFNIVRADPSISSKADEVISSFNAYNNTNKGLWPSDEPTIQELIELKKAQNFDKETLKHWTCKNKKCCFSQNLSSHSSCIACKTKINKWVCESCSALNRETELSCSACFTVRAETENISIKKREKEEIEKKKAEEELIKSEDLKNKTVASQVGLNKKLLQLEIEFKANSIVEDEGKFVHLGTFIGCGGNPEGRSALKGNNECDPIDCVECGSNTHWSCCSSTDKGSRYCREGISSDSAKRNAELLSTKSSPKLISEIVGITLEHLKYWTCCSCNFNNTTKDNPKCCQMCKAGIDEIKKDIAKIKSKVPINSRRNRTRSRSPVSSAQSTKAVLSSPSTTGFTFGSPSTPSLFSTPITSANVTASPFAQTSVLPSALSSSIPTTISLSFGSSLSATPSFSFGSSLNATPSFSFSQIATAPISLPPISEIDSTKVDVKEEKEKKKDDEDKNDDEIKVEKEGKEEINVEESFDKSASNSDEIRSAFIIAQGYPIGILFTPGNHYKSSLHKDHALKYRGESGNSGWGCDGRHQSNGCKSERLFGRTSITKRFRCDTHDFDLCGPCMSDSLVEDCGREEPTIKNSQSKSKKSKNYLDYLTLVSDPLKQIALEFSKDAKLVSKDKNDKKNEKIVAPCSSLPISQSCTGDIVKRKSSKACVRCRNNSDFCCNTCSRMTLCSTCFVKLMSVPSYSPSSPSYSPSYSPYSTSFGSGPTIIRRSSRNTYDKEDDDEDDDKNGSEEDDDEDENENEEESLTSGDENYQNNDSLIIKDNNKELEYNNSIAESYFVSGTPSFSSNFSNERDLIKVDDADLDLDSIMPTSLVRSDSVGFYSTFIYEEIETIKDLITFKDKDGNTAAHYCAKMGLSKSLKELYNAGCSKWVENTNSCSVYFLETLQSSKDLESVSISKQLNILHKALTKRNFVCGKLLNLVLLTPFSYSPDNILCEIVKAFKKNNEDEAEFLTLEALNSNHPHRFLYRALFMHIFNYGTLQSRPQLLLYEECLIKEQVNCLDPHYFYLQYLFWKNARSSYAKKDRLKAADSLKSFRFFENVSKLWLTGLDNIDLKISEEGLDDHEEEEEEEDYNEFLPPPGPYDPETLWELSKKNHNVVSSSMDKLMNLTGLKAVKKICIQVALEILLTPPADLDSSTSMNLLFVGNPGCGKTTVATLLAAALFELGYRKNPDPVLTNASDILSTKDPGGDFLGMIKKAEGGTLFIDEAYLFDPAPKGSRANDSNKVLDTLLKVSETLKKTTTFILAGYKEEIQKLLMYNPGFPSRFPKEFTFDFEDFTESQMCKIYCDMAKQKGYRFSSKKECGVSIPKVMSRRMHRGAGSKGYGNGRVVEKVLEKCQKAQKARLGMMKLHNLPISDKDYKTLTRSDTVGERPNLEDSEYFKELNSMIGLKQVKETMKNLMNLQLQNYDSEMEGEKIKQVSLHRLFLGNSGTGKTTVARLYGRLLKDFGLLSDGDCIYVTPSDLKGIAQGEAASNTKNLIESAKGKIVIIDEAYNLDPNRNNNNFGAEVIDTLVEKMNREAGADMCIVLAGYETEVNTMLRNCKNPGLKSRFKAEEAFFFEDFSDENIKKVLKMAIVNEYLCCEPSVLDFATKQISRRRRSEGFANASEAKNLLERAKLRLSGRKAKAMSEGVTLKNPYLLIESDFILEETSPENARQILGDLENADHILALIDSLEATLTMAKADGKDIVEVLGDSHMLFCGPPGTGKTTVAQRFGAIFKQLDLLEKGHVEIVTAGNLIDRYVGGSSNNVIEAMKRAKGGILFIDEAYGIIPSNSTYGKDVIQALVDNISLPEFKGKIIIIFGGYKDQIEKLFDGNVAFQSKFDKIRIEFPEWTGENCARATIKKIEKEGKRIVQEAKEILPYLFEHLRSLPNWASAREVYETFYPALYTARAQRLFKDAATKRVLQNSAESGNTNYNKAISSSSTASAAYEAEDVRSVFELLISRRGGNILDEFSPVDTFAKTSATQIKMLESVSDFNGILSKCKMNGKVLVVNFSATWCLPCQVLKDQYEKLNREIAGLAAFCKVDIDIGKEIAGMFNIQMVPTTKIFLNGSEIDSISGGSIEQIKKVTLSNIVHAPKDIETKSPKIRDNGADDAVLMKNKVNIKVNVKKRDHADDEKEEDGSLEEDDAYLWAALESACGELGYSLENMKEMLESPSFPYDDVMLKIMEKTGSSDTGKIKLMLGKQKASVLQKVTAAIKLSHQLKTEEEKKVQEKLKRLGRCPMNFEWIKMEGGYRCAGGSHWVDNEQIKAYRL